MPQGKGSYGSEVGKPPKKQKKYQTGGEVLGASTMGQELESISLKSTEPDYPIADAMERSETYQLGGAVKPPTAPSMTPTPQYGKGGPVKSGSQARSSKQKEAHRIAAEKAKKRIAKEKMEYGRPKKKKKWSGQA